MKRTNQQKLKERNWKKKMGFLIIIFVVGIVHVYTFTFIFHGGS